METEVVFRLMKQYYQQWPSLERLVVELESTFNYGADARIFYLPKRLLVKGFGTFYSLRDGTTVWYGHNQPLFRSWREGQRWWDERRGRKEVAGSAVLTAELEKPGPEEEHI
jgi:hypothetical protein